MDKDQIFLILTIPAPLLVIGCYTVLEMTGRKFGPQNFTSPRASLSSWTKFWPIPLYVEGKKERIWAIVIEVTFKKNISNRRMRREVDYAVQSIFKNLYFAVLPDATSDSLPQAFDHVVDRQRKIGYMRNVSDMKLVSIILDPYAEGAEYIHTFNHAESTGT